ATQDDLARRPGGVDPALTAEIDADGAAALEQDLLGERLGDDLQVAALHRWAQIADRGRAAPAVARRRLVIADAFLAGAVEIVVARIAHLDRALDEGFADRMVVGHVRHAERATAAVKFVAAARLVLGTPEIGQDVVERPAGVAELAPMIEILGLAADIDHAVDRG